MKFFTVIVTCLLCSFFYQPLHAQNTVDSLAEVMVARAKLCINKTNYDSASTIGYELLAYARRHKLPEYEAAAWTTLGIVAYYNNQAEAALEHYDSALSIRRRYLGNDHPDVVGALTSIAVIISDLLGDPDAALERLDEAEQICARRKDVYPEQTLSSLYNNLGNTHADRGNYEKAEQYYLKAYDIRSKHPDDPSFKLAALLNNLGALKIETGHLAAAQDYLLRSEALYLQWNKGKPTIDLVEVWQNLGSIANFEFRFTDAKTWFRRALQLGETEADNQYLQFGALHYNLGATLFSEDSLDAAAMHYRMAIDFWETYFGFHSDLPAAYVGMGLIDSKRGQFETALQHFRFAEKLDEVNFPTQHPRPAHTFKIIGNFFDQRGDRTQARVYYQKQLQALGMDEIQASALNAARPSYLLLAGLTDLGKLHFDEFRQYGDTAQLDTALQVFALGDSVLNRLREIRLTFSEQKELLRDARRLAEWAMLAEMAKYGPRTERTFARSEQTRAYSLYGKFGEDAAVRYAGVPDSLTATFRSLQYEIARAETHFREMSPTEADYFTIQARLAVLRQDLAGVKGQLGKFDQYYKFRFGAPTASLRDVQQKILRPGELMLQYFVGDSNILVFTIGKDRYETHVIPNDFQLDAKVQAMWRGINDPYASERNDPALWASSLKDYEQNALELYRHLVFPLQLRPADSMVIIVPDGALWQLPFDALLTQAPEESGAFNNYPYLMLEHRTVFAYSATLMREAMAQPRLKANAKAVLACAPFDQVYKDSNPNPTRKFGYLPESGWEVRQANRLLGGDVLLGPAGTKAAVLSQISQYHMLLFSTHSQTSDAPFVAFYPEKDRPVEHNLLFAEEVYNLQIKAEVVILSACETALGRSEPGEGLVSMARAFTYAGAKGLVTTLWSVNDYSNSRITVAMLGYIKQGKSVQEALGMAKRDWLHNPSAEAAHPWFWAGVVGLGVLR